MEYLSYSIFILDEEKKTFNLIYEDSNIYSIINFYSYLTKKFKSSYIKVCRDLQIFKGDSYV